MSRVLADACESLVQTFQQIGPTVVFYNEVCHITPREIEEQWRSKLRHRSIRSVYAAA